jgi:hypothetical protein
MADVYEDFEDEDAAPRPLRQEEYTAEVYCMALETWLDKFEKLAFDSAREALNHLKEKLQTYIGHIDKTLAVIKG